MFISINAIIIAFLFLFKQENLTEGGGDESHDC